MAKKSVLLSLVILTVGALGATASAQLEGEPNCILIGYFPQPVCHCDPTTPAPKEHVHGTTYSYDWWKYTGACNGEGQPCPWEHGGIHGPIVMKITIPNGMCVKDVRYYWCVSPPATLAVCVNGVCPDGPRNYFNKLEFTATYYECN